MKNYYIYLVAWFGMVILAILNGTLRNEVYGNYLSELSAHQLSTLFLIILFAIYIYLLTKMYNIESAKQSIIIGLIWLIMTILFEFGFGHYIAGNSWEMLFNDYNIFDGRVWILILIWTAISPYVFYKINLRLNEKTLK